MGANEALIERLLQVVPELKPHYEEHLADHDKLLPHVFMGDVTRFAIRESATPPRLPVVERLLTVLEAGLSGPEEVQELIVASFVENLMGEKGALKTLKPLAGPLLREQIEAICG